MSRNKLYALLSTACAIGYIWLTVSYFRGSSNDNDPGACLFKHITNIPCPSCGSTRSVLSLLRGDISGSVNWNPFGLILIVILVFSPVWILYDVVNQKVSLLKFYKKTELYLKRKYIGIPAILIVLINWVWNIHKGV